MSNQEKKQYKEEMFAIIEESLSSRLTNKAFCKEKGIAEWMYYYWKKKYREEQSPGGFIPIRVHPSSQAVNAVIEIAYPNGVIMRLPAQTPANILREYIRL